MELSAAITEVRAVRLDKWLWAARFYKTRGLAQAAIEKAVVRWPSGKTQELTSPEPNRVYKVEEPE